jgi:hypothetical protein
MRVHRLGLCPPARPPVRPRRRRRHHHQFAEQTLELPPERRIFRSTVANRLAPEPCAPESLGEDCEQRYRSYGRVCGMALAMGELANFSFAPYFLQQVLLPDSIPSAEEMLEMLREDDPVLCVPPGGHRAPEGGSEGGREGGREEKPRKLHVCQESSRGGRFARGVCVRGGWCA